MHTQERHRHTPLNIPPTSWVDPRIEVRDSHIHGLGVFATAPIASGETLIIWGGAIFSLEDIRNGAATEHSYAAIRPGVFLGHPRLQGNGPDDYVNHSCNPNLWMTNEITWEARRDIQPGEELTADCAMYWGPDGDEEVEWQCFCGANACRQKFTTHDWKRPELQERYGNHFAPYINEQIRLLNEIPAQHNPPAPPLNPNTPHRHQPRYRESPKP